MSRTPGPWHVDGRMIGTNSACVALLCQFDSFGGIHDAANADDNGPLLAAAPDLLAACRYALMRLPQPLDDRDMSGSAQTYRAVRDAIDKATSA